MKDESTYTVDDFPEEIIIEPRIKEKTQTEKNEQGEQAFEADEHRDIGNFAFYKFLEGLDESSEIKSMVYGLSTVQNYELYDPEIGEKKSVELNYFKISDGLALSPGEIVALAGDFFASPEPIAFGDTEEERERRFEEALATLTHHNESEEKVKKVLRHIEADAAATSPHAHWRVKFVKKVKEVLADKTSGVVDINNIEYGIEMADEESLSGFWHSPYFDLAIRNFDHFGSEAVIAYQTGHKLALRQAQQAGKTTAGEKKSNLLKNALLLELYACHFLTDLFAAGHIRVPRKQLLNYLTQASNQDLDSTPQLESVSSLHLTVAGFFARKMHDEDGDVGLYVKPKSHTLKESQEKKSYWKAYGDGNFYQDSNKANARKACETMILALKDLQLAYEQKLDLTQLDKNLEDYIPEAFSKADAESQLQAMFEVKNNTLHCRDVSKNILLTGYSFFNVKVKSKMGEYTDYNAEKVQELGEQLDSVGVQCSLM